ncbi:unnamed protein product [Durusdinium trenchii]|uniref:PDZ domain-containing protein n=1 Tax=Durusdinium trenchii TaxID=1381693 RepID=A0ABP0R3L2_9DINO
MDLEVEIENGGLLGFVPRSWPPGPVILAAVLPESLAAQHELRRGDELRSVNGRQASSLDRSSLALELAKRPLSLRLHRNETVIDEVVIDVHIGVDDGAVGFLPKQWPPGPVVVGTVMPHKVVAQHGVQEGDVLKLVANQKASLMSSADLTKVLSQRPLSLRFVRGMDLSDGPLGEAETVLGEASKVDQPVHTALPVERPAPDVPPARCSGSTQTAPLHRTVADGTCQTESEESRDGWAHQKLELQEPQETEQLRQSLVFGQEIHPPLAEDHPHRLPVSPGTPPCWTAQRMRIGGGSLRELPPPARPPETVAELRALPTPTLVARREDADVALRQWLETTSLPEDAVIF